MPIEENYSDKTLIDSNWRSFYEDISIIRKEINELMGHIYDPTQILTTFPLLFKKVKSLRIALSPWIGSDTFMELDKDLDKMRIDMNNYFFDIKYLSTNPYEFPIEKEVLSNIEKIVINLMKIQDKLGLLARSKDEAKSNVKEGVIKKWLEIKK